jgi:hypothetical protein
LLSTMITRVAMSDRLTSDSMHRRSAGPERYSTTTTDTEPGRVGGELTIMSIILTLELGHRRHGPEPVGFGGTLATNRSDAELAECLG